LRDAAANAFGGAGDERDLTFKRLRGRGSALLRSLTLTFCRTVRNQG
jgi:hypothetical protein